MKIKIFININILTCENINLIIFIRIDYIDNYFISFNFNIILFTRFFIKQEIIFQNFIFIFIYLYIIILIEYIILSLEDNFLFEFFKNNFVILFIVIINSLFHIILI